VSQNNHTRRRVLLGTGALVAGTASSIAFLSDNSAATASVTGSYTIPDRDAVLADTTLTDVRLQTDATWAFDANAEMHTVETEVHVGPSTDNLELIARQTKEDLAKASLTGESSLEGSLMSAGEFGVEDFRPTNGELATSVVADLRLYVLRHGEVAVEAIQQTTFTVTVRDEELAVEPTLSGEGSVEVVTESGE
jgi:hypothetical protein